MYDCEKHIDLVIKACKGLEKSELNVFLSEVIGMSNNEIIIMKKLFGVDEKVIDNKANKVKVKKEKKTAISSVIAADVLEHKNQYTVGELAKKYNKCYQNVYKVLQVKNLLEYVKRPKNDKKVSMSNSNLRNEIMAFADKN
jgi:hypothetical protein